MSILCDKPQNQYTPWDCATDEESYSYVSRTGFFRTDPSITDFTDSLQWDTAKTAGELNIHPKVDGTYLPNPEFGKAYGPKSKAVRKNEHTVVFMIPFKKDDPDYINSLNLDDNEGFYFVTGADEHLFVIDKPVSVLAKPLFDKGAEEIVDIEITVTWNKLKMSNSYPIPAAVKSSA